MKNIRFLTFVLILGTLVLSACGAAAVTPTAAPEAATSVKAEGMPVSFVGIVDSIAGDQWVISGTTVTVHESIVRDGPFNVGDQVKVEGQVNPDGLFTVSRVEAPKPQETATLPPVSVDNSNEAISNANTNDANVNDSNSNDDNGGANSNDDNSNTSNSNDSNINDDNGANTNDDNSNDGNTNDDSGGNSNDDNSNDDHGGNSNDDSGNDDNSGNSGNDDSGGDDNGSGGNGSDD